MIFRVFADFSWQLEKEKALLASLQERVDEYRRSLQEHQQEVEDEDFDVGKFASFVRKQNEAPAAEEAGEEEEGYEEEGYEEEEADDDFDVAKLASIMKKK